MWKAAEVVSILTLMMLGGTESITDRRIILQDGYSIHELPPTLGQEPLLVNFSVNLRNILGVNEKDQYISLETSLRMYWMDTRVKVDDSLMAADREYITLNPKVQRFSSSLSQGFKDDFLRICVFLPHATVGATFTEES